MVQTIKPGIHAVFVHTKDLKRSVSWYSWLLDLPFKEEDIQSPVYNIPVEQGVYLTIDDHKFDPSYSFVKLQTPVFNFYSNDLMRSYEVITESGIKVTTDIELDGNFGWFNIEDPDGHIVMICGENRDGKD